MVYIYSIDERFFIIFKPCKKSTLIFLLKGLTLLSICDIISILVNV